MILTAFFTRVGSYELG